MSLIFLFHYQIIDYNYYHFKTDPKWVAKFFCWVIVIDALSIVQLQKSYVLRMYFSIV